MKRGRHIHTAYTLEAEDVQVALEEVQRVASAIHVWLTDEHFHHGNTSGNAIVLSSICVLDGSKFYTLSSVARRVSPGVSSSALHSEISQSGRGTIIIIRNGGELPRARRANERGGEKGRSCYRMCGEYDVSGSLTQILVEESDCSCMIVVLMSAGGSSAARLRDSVRVRGEDTYLEGASFHRKGTLEA
ncbi:hypothetical protein Tco_1576593 [Tanacetum coccineum]